MVTVRVDPENRVKPTSSFMNGLHWEKAMHKCVAGIFFLVLTRFAASASQVPEIPDTTLNDIAMVSWYQGAIPALGIRSYNGPVVIYNPIIVQQAGPLVSAFFYAHEYCHISLNHIRRRFFDANPFNMAWLSQSLETEADVCATQSLIARNNINAVRAAAHWFYGQGYIPQARSHPPGAARADNIRRTANALGVSL